MSQVPTGTHQAARITIGCTTTHYQPQQDHALLPIAVSAFLHSPALKPTAPPPTMYYACVALWHAPKHPVSTVQPPPAPALHLPVSLQMVPLKIHKPANVAVPRATTSTV